ncbi:GCN5 family acetyltransferase [Roseiconus nitratireducens]|uniref:GCN5 family acetyltransferase n=1 Tax=Roseiconus nitratireducens TaxID=2605748 RepID=A0A5M6CWX9_9BACT|nr:GCN5 family acetyltransferase [Roseiconus nitratireducens]KAA5538502.1 GCN5 family acetyltransferase [Roseiconus nitratireducens]
MTDIQFPAVLDADLVGYFDAEVGAGGGYVWDAVLEYRVWLYPDEGAADECDGSDYYRPFASYGDAFEFYKSTDGAQEPIALVLQREYIDENEEGEFEHVAEPRLTEWPVEFLSRPKRTPNTIPDFFSPNAPANRLDILRGKAAS